MSVGKAATSACPRSLCHFPRSRRRRAHVQRDARTHARTRKHQLNLRSDEAARAIHCFFFVCFFSAASPLVYPGKSRGDEAPNLSWRRHKPFICMAEIRGSHFIRRAVAPDMLARPASPGAPPETRPFNDTGPRRARQEDTRLVSRVLT